MPGPYQITIYTAMPGTPLVDKGRQIGASAAGHMWYQVADAETANSYGFAPKDHGASSGPGLGYRGDTDMYQDPFYSRTMEITPQQYARLKAYGEAAVNGDWRSFKGEYNGATNSCVDFTWGALKHAGFTIHRPEIRTHDETVVSPDQRAEAQRFKEQLGERLGQLGMSERQVDTLAAAAVKEQTRFASQGEVQVYHLSKDATTIALQQPFPPLREFGVERALGQSEQDQWRETMAMSKEAPTSTQASPDVTEARNAPSPSANPPVLSLG